MRDEIGICEKTEKGTLRILDTKMMTTRLLEEPLRVVTKYKGQEYTVLGNIYFFYIII